MLTAITIFTTLASFLLGIHTLRFRRSTVEHRYFAAFCFVIALWSVFMYQSLLNPGILIVRIVMVLAALMILTLFLFSYYFVTEHPNQTVTYSAYAFCATVIALAVTPLLYSEIIVNNGVAYPVAGPGVYFFGLYSIGGVLGALVLLFRAIIRERERTMIRVQVEWIALGLIGSLSFMILFGFVLLNLWHTNEYIPVTMLSPLLFIGCTAYAMTRYRFLDVRVWIKKSLLHSGFLILLATLYTAIVLQVYYSIQRIANVDPIVWLVTVPLIFVIIFESTHRRMKIFLDGRYVLDVIDFTNFIRDNNHVFNSLHELESYVLELAGRVQRYTHADVTQIFVRQRQYKRFKSFYPQGSRGYVLFSDEVATAFEDKKIRGVRLVGDIAKKAKSPRLQQFFRKYRAQAYMTIEGPEKEILAIILIGKHKNNFVLEPYNLQKLSGLAEAVGPELFTVIGVQLSLEGARVTLLQNS